VPQAKKKSPVYAYFVCEYKTDGCAVIDSTRYICFHKDHNGHPVRVAHCKVTANLKQHLVGKHSVVVSSTHLGGRAAGECSSGSGGFRPAVANTRTGGKSGGVWRALGRQGLGEWMVAAD